MADEPTVPIENLRRFDQNLLASGARRAHRVDEPVPFCWFCDRSSGVRSKEHIFPRWLLEYHDAMDEIVRPIRVNMGLGGALASERNARPLRAHVNGEVCAPCNNGWMSALEVVAKPILTRPLGGFVNPEEARILAQWFAKIAVNLNVSQPFRLLVDSTSRHGLVKGVPDRFAVHLFTVRKQNGVFDWVQKSPDMAICSGSWTESPQRLMELTLVTHIRVADLVGVVVYVPTELSVTDVGVDGTVQIHPYVQEVATWNDLPVFEDYMSPTAQLDLDQMHES